MKLRNKVHRNFKFSEQLDRKLRVFSKKSNITQTRLVELALQQFFAVKR